MSNIYNLLIGIFGEYLPFNSCHVVIIRAKIRHKGDDGHFLGNKLVKFAAKL